MQLGFQTWGCQIVKLPRNPKTSSGFNPSFTGWLIRPEVIVGAKASFVVNFFDFSQFWLSAVWCSKRRSWTFAMWQYHNWVSFCHGGAWEDPADFDTHGRWHQSEARWFLRPKRSQVPSGDSPHWRVAPGLSPPSRLPPLTDCTHTQLDITQNDIAQIDITQIDITQIDITQIDIAQLDVTQLDAALPLLLRGRRGTCGICKGSDVRFGVVWSPLLCRCFCLAGVGLAVAVPIGDAKILRWCLPGMRVWRLAVCKLRSG